MAKSSKSSVNHFFRKIFNSFEESVVVNLQISHLPIKIQDYIREIVGTTEVLLGRDSISAVLLFGSAVYSLNQFDKISDVDLMIIVKNSISNHKIKEIRPILTGIVIKHRYRNYSKNWHARMLHIIERSTGMFCSFFISTESNWKDSKFAKIFSTNPILTNLLAPNKIVLDSMRAGTTILYNANTEIINIEPNQKSYPITQILKSLLLNLMMSLGTLFILFFNKSYIKYMLESIKWSIRSCDFYLNREINPLSEIVRNYTKLGIEESFLQRFLELRKNPERDLIFCLKVPYNIIKIHLITLKFKKKNYIIFF
jgi:predicted nucleotidyltransferase